MFGTWDGPDIAAFWFALGAFILSLGSVGYTRAAHRREVRRERERKRPDVYVGFDKWVKESIVAVLVIENLGGKVINQATIKAAREDPKRLVGFAEDETKDRSREHTFRNLEPGVPQTVHFVDLDKSAKERFVKFLVHFRHDDDAWERLYEAKLPPPGPVVLYGRPH